MLRGSAGVSTGMGRMRVTTMDGREMRRVMGFLGVMCDVIMMGLFGNLAVGLWIAILDCYIASSVLMRVIIIY